MCGEVSNRWLEESYGCTKCRAVCVVRLVIVGRRVMGVLSNTCKYPLCVLW